MQVQTTRRPLSIGNLRSLPPRERAEALRGLLRCRFGNKPGIAGFRQPIKEKTRQVLAALAIFVTLATLAHPAHAGAWRLDVNLASYHTERWARESLNQRNPGLGVEYAFNRNWSIAAGVYNNSYRRPTVYALAEWTPLHLGGWDQWHIDAGLAVGLASGYRRAEIPCAPLAGAAVIRIASPAGVALNILGVPNGGSRQSGFLGFQVSFPLHLR